jgi:hypothetical protein
VEWGTWQSWLRDPASWDAREPIVMERWAAGRGPACYQALPVERFAAFNAPEVNKAMGHTEGGELNSSAVSVSPSTPA